MEKIESKIKSAEDWVDEFMSSFIHGVDLSGNQVHELVNTFKSAQRQAIKAIGEGIKQKAYGLHYEDAFDKNPSFVDVCCKCVDDLINSDELKVS